MLPNESGGHRTIQLWCGRSLTASLPSPANSADATTHRTDVRNFRCAVDRTIPAALSDRAPAGGEHKPRRLGGLRLPNRPQRRSSDALLPPLRRDHPHPRMSGCGPANRPLAQPHLIERTCDSGPANSGHLLSTFAETPRTHSTVESRTQARQRASVHGTTQIRHPKHSLTRTHIRALDGEALAIQRRTRVQFPAAPQRGRSDTQNRV